MRHHHRQRRHRRYGAWGHSPDLHGWGFWGRRGRFFRPGEVRLALLSLLSEGPKHGYELMRQLEERSGGVYRASAGTIYPTLQQLNDEGLVTSSAENGKRVYQLTGDGERELEEQAAAVRRIWRRADEWGQWGMANAPEAWEITRPAMEVMKAALDAVSHSAGDTERVERVIEILDRAADDLRDLPRDD